MSELESKTYICIVKAVKRIEVLAKDEMEAAMLAEQEAYADESVEWNCTTEDIY